MTSLEDLGVKPSARLFIQHCPDGTERWLEMSPSYDLTAHPKNYGIHGADLRFGIKRGRVTVVLHWMTPFYLPHLREKLDNNPWHKKLFSGLGSIDYHLPIPTWEGQTPVENCEYTGGDCYCDGSGLEAGKLFDRAVADPAQIWVTMVEWLEEAEKRMEAEITNKRNLS